MYWGLVIFESPSDVIATPRLDIIAMPRTKTSLRCLDRLDRHYDYRSGVLILNLFMVHIFSSHPKLTREQGVRLDTKAKKKGNLFGLGRGWYLTDKETEAILFAMDWDGTQLTPEGASIPYKLTKEWFQ